jgi:hypothetical protein
VRHQHQRSVQLPQNKLPAVLMTWMTTFRFKLIIPFGLSLSKSS